MSDSDSNKRTDAKRRIGAALASLEAKKEQLGELSKSEQRAGANLVLINMGYDPDDHALVFPADQVDEGQRPPSNVMVNPDIDSLGVFPFQAETEKTPVEELYDKYQALVESVMPEDRKLETSSE